jgi:nicotinamide-nucleotide amidase
MHETLTNEIQSAEILCVGTELLLGQIVNTNAAWLARELSLLGIYSYYQTVVGDNPERLAEVLAIAAGRTDLIILTGGLGPTQDDLTMAGAAAFAGKRLVLHEPSKTAIQDYFHSLGRRQVTHNNWKQAMMPEGALVLPNHNGTAPGAVLETAFEGHTVTLALLPGPPREMQLMFRESLQPYLQQRTQRKLRHQFVHMIGIGESAAEDALLDLISQQQNPTLASYASDGEVMFRITQAYQSEDEPDLTLAMLGQVKDRLGDYIYEVGPRSMAEVVKDLLAEKRLTISFAESCTGGTAAAMLTEIPGASRVFKGAVVAYDNQVKSEHLYVKAATLQAYGAVSEECAIEMARGCRDVFKSDTALAVTGVAGPDGGTPEKPVGLVWLAVCTSSGCHSKKMQLRGSRQRIRQVAALNALDLIRRSLLI